MAIKNPIILLSLVLSIAASCTGPKRILKYDPSIYPQPVDTRTRTITFQTKKTYSFASGVFFDNQFDGARLNRVTSVNDTAYTVLITPENEPINYSPYYAFKVWKNTPGTITVRLTYPPKYHHRYVPKMSSDGMKWHPIDSLNYTVSADTNSALLRVFIPRNDTIWIAAQELKTSKMTAQWVQQKAKNPRVSVQKIGKSTLGRPLWFMNIGTPDDAHKDIIVVLTRQHPPEVSGHLAFDAFIDEMLVENRRNEDFFKQYQLWVFPMMNPDGVDLGHWRHNAGGIDLNRDWAYYHQPETRGVTRFIINRAKKKKTNVVLGLDFHSTQHDIYYTFPDSLDRKLRYFNHYWIQGIDESLPPYPSVTEPYDINSPISKAWFLLQFGAESITFEIGDETPRDFIQMKGRNAARELTKLLINNSNRCKRVK